MLSKTYQSSFRKSSIQLFLQTTLKDKSFVKRKSVEARKTQSKYRLICTLPENPCSINNESAIDVSFRVDLELLKISFPSILILIIAQPCCPTSRLHSYKIHQARLKFPRKTTSLGSKPQHRRILQASLITQRPSSRSSLQGRPRPNSPCESNTPISQAHHPPPTEEKPIISALRAPRPKRQTIRARPPINYSSTPKLSIPHYKSIKSH